MKFLVSSTDYGWRNVRIIEAYPCLKDFGFKVESRTVIHKGAIKDENGKRISQEFPRTVEEPFIEINSPEDLIRLRDAVDWELVITKPDDNRYEIEIYDGYRE